MPQDPAEIQRQIEATRVELASTVDQIAARLDPRTLAKRGTDQAKAKLASVNGGGPRGALAPVASFYRVTGAQPTAQHGSATEYGTKVSIRWDRVGLTAAVALVVVWLRRRRQEHD